MGGNDGFLQIRFPVKKMKAHATSYAILANATQFLKVKYPIEFFCSHLQQAVDENYNLIKNVAKRKYGVKFYMPEINKSSDKFTIYDNKIVWSLSSMKGVGLKAAKEIISKQPFTSFHDFFERINKRIVNIKVVKVLIIANVFREFGKRNRIAKIYGKLRKDKEYLKMTKEEWELEASKVMTYFKQSVRDLFPTKTKSAITYEEFSEAKIGKRVIVAGIIENYREINSKRGMMILMKVSDSGENFAIVCWNNFYNRLSENGIKLDNGLAVRVSGYKNLSNLEEEQITLGRESGAYVKVLT